MRVRRQGSWLGRSAPPTWSARGRLPGLLTVLLALWVPTAAQAAASPQGDAGDAGDAGGAAAPTADSASAAVFVDPAGLLLFGPTLGGELALGKASLTLYGRWLDGGYVAGKLFPDEDDGEEFAFSYGVGLKGRFYLEGDLQGPFGGVALEFLRTRIEHEDRRIATNAQYIVPQLEGGYRHPWGAFFIGGAGAVGYALELDDSVENIDGGTDADLYEVEDASTVYGSVAVELGLRF